MMIEKNNIPMFQILKKVNPFFFFFSSNFFFLSLFLGLFVLQLTDKPTEIEPAVIGLSIALVVTVIFLISSLIYICVLRKKSNNNYQNL
jgi:heme/copper-type cytochrome/quinol oxidase subunit 3